MDVIVRSPHARRIVPRGHRDRALDLVSLRKCTNRTTRTTRTTNPSAPGAPDAFYVLLRTLWASLRGAKSPGE